MATVDWSFVQGLPFKSMLEFGVAEGRAYRSLKPASYLGIEKRVIWEPENGEHTVVANDIFSWEPNGHRFDLVLCDAHEGVDSGDERLYAITKRQIELALQVEPKYILVDDCTVGPICQAAFDALGPPTYRIPVAFNEGRQTDCCLWENPQRQNPVLPWERPDAPARVIRREPKMQLAGTPGPRTDLPRCRPATVLPATLIPLSFGIVVMCHRGYANGRLSVLLSSIPENLSVTVCSDAVAQRDVIGDREVAEYHGAAFHHSTPWAGRAGNAISCMACTDWTYTLFLCDDVWLFPETPVEMLRWSHIFHEHRIPMAALAAPRFETYAEHPQYGFSSWQECLDQPWRFECLPPPVEFQAAPALYTNPFGACMMVYRPAYEDLGGFAADYWAHDDVFNHKVWLSETWVNCCYPGRGFVHLGAQSWHEGETAEWVGAFDGSAATRMSAEESGRRQKQQKIEWAVKLGATFEELGGTPEL